MEASHIVTIYENESYPQFIFRRLCGSCSYCSALWFILFWISLLLFVVTLTYSPLKIVCREHTCNYTIIDNGEIENDCSITVVGYSHLYCIHKHSSCCKYSNLCPLFSPYSDTCYIYENQICPVSSCPTRTNKQFGILFGFGSASILLLILFVISKLCKD